MRLWTQSFACKYKRNIQIFIKIIGSLKISNEKIGQKLKGRENYYTWKFAVQNFLEHEELGDAVLGIESNQKKITKPKTKLVLLIDPINFVHVQEATTAKRVWENLKNAFDDSGLTRHVSLLEISSNYKVK